MRYLNRLTFLLILFSLIVSMPGTTFAKGDKNSKRIKKTTGDPKVTWFTINNIATIFSNEAMSDLNGQDSGFEFPVGSNKTVFYESGFVYGGLYKGEWRMGGSTYFHSQVPGRILPDGTPEDPNLAHVRIFRVRRDYKNPDADFSKENYKQGLSIAEIKSQYDSDWKSWPWQYGAPYEDVNGDGTYDPNIDIPGVAGADQTIWFVCNDLDPTKQQQFYGTLGLGMEMQATIWGYNASGALGNALFRRYTLVNKGGENIDSMYVCMWSDPDLGDANDDYTGCDTTLSLGYIYNGDDNDSQYGANSPASGFDFFQGPIVEGAPSDEAIFKGKILPGYKNLEMTSYFFFINRDNVYTDPEDGEKIGSLQFRNLFEGKVSTTGSPFIDPTTKLPTKLTLYGDPITGRGWIDGILHGPGDRRLGMTAGPFVFAAGDTQEVVIGQFAAGAIPGVNRLGAVGLLKFYDLELQQAYDNFFQVPPQVKAPVVTITPLDQKVALVWGDRADIVAQTEAYDALGYKFEGYVVYQFPNTSPILDNAKTVATFDVKNLVQSIESTVFDAASNSITKKFTKSGTDGGIQRTIVIDKDLIRSGFPPLANGTTYYYAVTAYAYNPDPEAVPNVLETPPVVLAVTPQAANPGVTMVDVGSTISYTHTKGASDGQVIAKVVNPAKVNGNTYEISFVKGNNGRNVWNLTNKTKNTLVSSNNLEGTSPDIAPIVDGIQVNVSGAPSDFKEFIVIANANGPLATPEMGTFGFNNNGFPLYNGSDRPSEEQQVGPAEWGICTGTTSANDPSYAYFKTRVARNDNFIRIVPYDYEIRFTAQGSKSQMAFTTGTIFDVPFEVWNTGIGTPKDPSDDYKCVAFVYDSDGNDIFNLVNIDHAVSGGDNDPETDWFYIYDVTDHTPGTAGYDAAVASNFDEATGSSTIDGEVMARLVFVNWNGGSVGAADFPANVNQVMPEQGTIFRIGTTKPNVPGLDVFSFTAPKVDYNAEKAKDDVDLISAFPNPYYGVNPRETNKYQRYITFNHLPAKATIRIFNLAGQLVYTKNKNSENPFETWNLSNDANIPVASGLYIVHIDMPDLGKTKILKVAIIQEQQFLDRF